jgi:hypothetical protein
MQIDHIFVCVPKGGRREAGRLLDLGILEGPPNNHPGQGTACRRFFFDNFMLELIWVEDAAEAFANPVGLGERWSAVMAATRNASPFGMILRPKMDGDLPAAPFPHWEYRPETMPGLRLWIASETSIEEPMWCVLPIRSGGSGAVPQRSTEHPAGMRELTSVRLHSPAHFTLDPRAFAGEVIDWQESATGRHWIELEFDSGASGRVADLRPELPVLLRW